MATASPKDLTAEQIWTVQPGERRSVGVIHIVILALLIGIGFVVGAFGSISFPLGFGVNFFWTGIAVQQVGGIWFGGWGVLAGAIFPFPPPFCGCFLPEAGGDRLWLRCV